MGSDTPPAPPSLPAFQPSRLDDEKPELMYYDVVHTGDDIRYPATFAGSRLIEAYGFSAVGGTFRISLAPSFGSISSRSTTPA